MPEVGGGALGPTELASCTHQSRQTSLRSARLARIDSRARMGCALECIHEGVEAIYAALGCIS